MNVNLETPGNNYAGQRSAYYESTSNQLDLLFHDIDSGKLGDDAKTSSFYLGRKAVKDKYPKS